MAMPAASPALPAARFPSSAPDPQKVCARILVAEDNATNREVALAQLQKLGYIADAVFNGAEAVGAIENGHYDLVLMDCEMPVMDGYEATHRIREAHPGIPIIAVTADAMSGDRERCLREGMNDYLAKPVEIGLLAASLLKWLPVSSADGSAPQSIEAVPGEKAPAAFNPESLLRRLMGDRKLAATVLQGFLEDAPSQLLNLQQRLEDADSRGARSQAHTLKGAAATVAAEGLQAIALQMERSAAVGRMDHYREHLPRAIQEFERFKSALHQWRTHDQAG
jgi:CheY-like chemotaxis protein